MFKKLKCWHKGHEYTKPRVSFGVTVPRVSEAVYCKNCGKRKQLTDLERFNTLMYAAEFNRLNKRERILSSRQYLKIIKRLG